MSYTNDFKDQHLDQLVNWVMDTKHNDIEQWCAGERLFNKDTYEDCVEAYIEDNAEELWNEYFNKFAI